MLVPLPGMLVNIILMIVYTMNGDVFVTFLWQQRSPPESEKDDYVATNDSLSAKSAISERKLLAVLRLQYAQIHLGLKSHGHSSPVASKCLSHTQCSTQLKAVRHVLPAAVPSAAP